MPDENDLFSCYTVMKCDVDSYMMAVHCNTDEICLDGDEIFTPEHPWYPLVHWMATNRSRSPIGFNGAEMEFLAENFSKLANPTWEQLIDLADTFASK